MNTKPNEQEADDAKTTQQQQHDVLPGQVSDDHIDMFDKSEEEVSDTQKEVESQIDNWLGNEPASDEKKGGEDDEAKDDEKKDEQGTPTGTQQSSEAKGGTVDDQKDKDKAQQGNAGSGKGAQTDQQGQPPEQSEPTGRISYSKEGHVYDGQGKLVARAGPERRLWEKGVRLQHELADANEKLSAYERQVSDVEPFAPAIEEAKKYNLDAPTLQMSAQLMAAYQTDPLGTMSYMLAEMAQRGYDLSQLFDDNGQPVARSGPIPVQQPQQAPQGSQQQTQTTEQNTDTDARAKVVEFFERYPDASPHGELLGNMVNRAIAQGINTSPEEAYWALREYAANNNLDFNQPLAPQIAALQGEQTQTQQQQSTQQQQPQHRAPIPANGRANANMAPHNAGGSQQRGVDSSFDEMDTEAIIRGSMRAAGLDA